MVAADVTADVAADATADAAADDDPANAPADVTGSGGGIELIGTGEALDAAPGGGRNPAAPTRAAVMADGFPAEIGASRRCC